MEFHTLLNNPELIRRLDADTIWCVIDAAAYEAACEIQSPNTPDFDQVVTGQSHRFDTMLEEAYMEWCAKQHPSLED